MAARFRSYKAALIGSFLAGALATPLVTVLAQQARTWGEAYRRIPPSYERIIETSEAAFMKRDVEAIGASLTDDFSWYRVTAAGPELMVTGREATLQRLQEFFASPAWTTQDSEVHRLGMIDNLLVQVEVDTLNFGKGPVRQTSLHVYEFRDGRRWREFVFYPAEP
jgi:ketosteroid isomerase-like protein